MLKWLLVPVVMLCGVAAEAQVVHRDLAYAEVPHERQVLDISAPENAAGLPVVFWIHGGGWQTGDKSDVEHKPRAFNQRGFVFVSTNYRLLPHVDMETLIGDVAQSLGWVHRHIAEYGGDPQRIIVGGHSAGAQLAALLCTDDRYLKEHDVSFSALKGCIPVDGDTYDIPAIILTAEFRARVYGKPMPTFGHRQKFGNDPEQHINFSAVTHVAPDKEIPPFLILYVAGHPDTTAQADRLGSVLREAGVSVQLFGGRRTDHSTLNDNIGLPEDPATNAVDQFLRQVSGDS